MGLNKNQRPQLVKRGTRLSGIRVSTAASTALDPRGVIALQTTSTGGPVVYTLNRAPKPGDEFRVIADKNASSSVAPFHINAASGTFIGSSSEEMLTLARAGAGAHLIAFSTIRWGVFGLSQPDSSGNLSTST